MDKAKQGSVGRDMSFGSPIGNLAKDPMETLEIIFLLK